MAAKPTPKRARKPEAETLLNTVARTVGSALGSIVAKTESVIEKRDEILETLKPAAAQVRRAVSSAKKAPARKKVPARKVATKKAAPKKRASSAARARKGPR
jgi:hypothetical protein